MKGAPPLKKFGKTAVSKNVAVGRITVVEEIIDPALDLIRLVDLIGRMHVEHGIRWQLRRLV